MSQPNCFFFGPLPPRTRCRMYLWWMVTVLLMEPFFFTIRHVAVFLPNVYNVYRWFVFSLICFTFLSFRMSNLHRALWCRLHTHTLVNICAHRRACVVETLVPLAVGGVCPTVVSVCSLFGPCWSQCTWQRPDWCLWKYHSENFRPPDKCSYLWTSSISCWVRPCVDHPQPLLSLSTQCMVTLLWRWRQAVGSTNQPKAALCYLYRLDWFQQYKCCTRADLSIVKGVFTDMVTQHLSFPLKTLQTLAGSIIPIR